MNALPEPRGVGTVAATTGGPTSTVPRTTPGAAGLPSHLEEQPMENVSDLVPHVAPDVDVAPAMQWAIVVLDEHCAHAWPEGLVLTPAAIRLSAPTSRRVLARLEEWRRASGPVPAQRRPTHHLAQLVRCDTVDGHHRWLVQSLTRLR